MNMTRDDELYRQINNFTPPIMSIFFVLSGMNLDVGALSAFGIVGIVYFLVRIVGKYLGAYLGCLAVKSEKPIRNYLACADSAGRRRHRACVSRKADSAG